MASKRKAAAKREVSDADLLAAVRALVRRASGVAGSEFKKELGPDYKGFDKRALELANDLAARREIHRFSTAKKVRFFASDPIEELGRVVARVLEAGPLAERDLKLRVEKEGRGLGDLVKEWLEGALARGEVHIHKAGKTKRLGARPEEPDVAGMLKPVFTALRKVLTSKDAARLDKSTILAAIAKELGMPLQVPPVPADDNRESFLRALRELSAESPANGLLPIRDLRTRLRLDKQSFDRITLGLSRDGLVTLHHHDFPASLSPAERQDLVQDDKGTHYVGIALRRNHA